MSEIDDIRKAIARRHKNMRRIGRKQNLQEKYHEKLRLAGMTESQNTQVLEFMKRRPITSLEALQHLGCMRLASRIHDLRSQGHEIVSDRVEVGNGKRVAIYYLVQTARQKEQE